MLVLTRKVGEKITIGDNVRVAVLEIKGSQVRLGIEAPPEVMVHREEIYQRIQQANIEAAQAPNSLKRLTNLWKKPKNRKS